MAEVFVVPRHESFESEERVGKGKVIENLRSRLMEMWVVPGAGFKIVEKTEQGAGIEIFQCFSEISVGAKLIAWTHEVDMRPWKESF